MTLPLVNYEQAKALKEAGFNYPTINVFVYKTKALKNYKQSVGCLKNHNATGAMWVGLPDIYLACQWLREVKGLHVATLCSGEMWGYDVINSPIGSLACAYPYEYQTHDLALSAGLDKALLILKVK